MPPSTLNPLADEPPPQDVLIIQRWGHLGLIWCAVRSAMKRDWQSCMRSLFASPPSPPSPPEVS